MTSATEHIKSLFCICCRCAVLFSFFVLISSCQQQKKNQTTTDKIGAIDVPKEPPNIVFYLAPEKQAHFLACREPFIIGSP